MSSEFPPGIVDDVEDPASAHLIDDEEEERGEMESKEETIGSRKSHLKSRISRVSVSGSTGSSSSTGKISVPGIDSADIHIYGREEDEGDATRESQGSSRSHNAESWLFLQGIFMTFSQVAIEDAFQAWRIVRFEQYSHIFYLIVAITEMCQSLISLTLSLKTGYDLSAKKFYKGNLDAQCGTFEYDTSCTHRNESEESTEHRTICITHGCAALVLFISFLAVLFRRYVPLRFRMFLQRPIARWCTALVWAGYVIVQMFFAVDSRWASPALLVVGVRVSLYVVLAVLLAGHRWPFKIFVALVALVAFYVKFVALIDNIFKDGDASHEGVLMFKIYGCLTFTTFVVMLLFYVWQLEVEIRELFVLHIGLRHDASRLKRLENPLSSSNISTWVNRDGNREKRAMRRPTLVATTSSAAGARRGYVPPPISLPATRSALALAGVEGSLDFYESGTASEGKQWHINQSNAAAARPGEMGGAGSATRGGEEGAGRQNIRLPWLFYGSHERVRQEFSTTSSSSTGDRDGHPHSSGAVRGKKDRHSDDSEDSALVIAKQHDTIEAAVSQWVIPHKYITRKAKRPVGAGSAGMVFRAEYMGAPVALKQVFTTMMDSELNEKNLREFANEVTALSRLGNHPYVVQFMGITKFPLESTSDLMPRLYFVTQFCPLSLEAYLEIRELPPLPKSPSSTSMSPSSSPKTKPPFPPKPPAMNRAASGAYVSPRRRRFHDDEGYGDAIETRRRDDGALIRMATQIASAMAHLHSHRTLHRDLKPANVLLTAGHVAQICDFGAAYEWNKRSARISRGDAQAGSTPFMPPELLRDSGSVESFKEGKAADVWSFGVLLIAMFTANRPWAHDGTWAKQFNFAFRRAVTQNNLRPHVPSDCPRRIRKIAECCLCRNPKKRPSFMRLLAALQRAGMKEEAGVAVL
eukprot:g3737.t1